MKILQVALRAEDLDRAAEFYERLLGEPPARRFDSPAMAFFDVGTSRLLLSADSPSSLFYLQVDDVAAFVDRARQAGVEVVTEPHVIHSHEDDVLGPADSDEIQAFLRDSEGNILGLVGFEPRHTP